MSRAYLQNTVQTALKNSSGLRISLKCVKTAKKVVSPSIGKRDCMVQSAVGVLRLSTLRKPSFYVGEGEILDSYWSLGETLMAAKP